MLRRLWRRTEVGRKQDVFSFSSHKMLFGLFGIDPAGNVICLLQHRANQTAGSWGVVVHDSVTWPLHWFAMQQRHKLRIEDVRNDVRLCKSAFMRRTYKFIRAIYLACVAYVWFLGYLVVKQNALNQDARIVLTELEMNAQEYFEKRIFGNITTTDDTNNNNNKNSKNEEIGNSLSSLIPREVEDVLRKAGKGIKEIAFAMAEDLKCYDNDQYLDDAYEMNLRKIELLKRLKKNNKKKEEEKTNLLTSSYIWKALVLVAGAAAFVLA